MKNVIRRIRPKWVVFTVLLVFGIWFWHSCVPKDRPFIGWIPMRSSPIGSAVYAIFPRRLYCHPQRAAILFPSGHAFREGLPATVYGILIWQEVMPKIFP